MSGRFAIALGLAAAISLAAGAQQKKDEPRKGAVTGVVTAQADNWIEVKADGEEKARRYHCPKKSTDLMKLITAAKVDSRIRLEWQFGEVYRITKFEILRKTGTDPDRKPDESRKGTVTGVVAGKGDNWIEVRADGEEKARRYVPHWKGGAPNDGGGPDKEMVARLKEIPVGSRVQLGWEFEERPRVVKIDLLKKPVGKK